MAPTRVSTRRPCPSPSQPMGRARCANSWGVNRHNATQLMIGTAMCTAQIRDTIKRMHASVHTRCADPQAGEAV